MDTLISLGKGYALYGAIVTTILGAIMIVVGRRAPDPEDAKYAMIMGTVIIAVGILFAYLAQKYNSFAEIYGVFFVLMVLSVVIGMIKK